MTKSVIQNRATTWEDERNARYRFHKVVESNMEFISRVHPLQQRAVLNVRNAVIDDDRVCTIMLFGSSTNMRCTPKSDLDMVIRLLPEFVNSSAKNEISEKVQIACDWNADILWYDRLSPNDRVYKECLEGVQIV